MNPYFTFNVTIQVNDLVFSSYHDKDIVFRVTKIERRYLSQNDIDKYTIYKDKGCIAGDESNPYVTIEPVVNLSPRANLNKKLRISIKSLDGGYLQKIDKNILMEHIKRLQQVQKDLFP